MNNFYHFLEKRGTIKDTTANIENLFGSGEMVSCYLGIDPTADSLHVGHLAAIILLKNFQSFGHKPFLLVGGATGMIGDPSFKSTERQFLSEEVLFHNQESIKKQLSNFLDFSSNEKNKAEMVNNADWLKQLSIIEFLREAGKHLTVNYMESKESVKRRIVEGISFTEFSYQLLQAYDFYYLFTQKNVKVQLGGADQWGNITSGVELIRRKVGQTAHGMTIPLLTKADGTKFGKSEGGNVWLDKNLTSPYDFYQYFINCADEDAKNLIAALTMLTNEEIEALKEIHNKDPKERILQKAIAKELMIFVHGQEEYQKALKTSEILFGGNNTIDDFKKLSEEEFLQICHNIKKVEISRNTFETSDISSIIRENCVPDLFSSNGEFKRAVQENSILINKLLISSEKPELLFDKYLLVQRGNKKYFIIIIK